MAQPRMSTGWPIANPRILARPEPPAQWTCDECFTVFYQCEAVRRPHTAHRWAYVANHTDQEQPCGDVGLVAHVVRELNIACACIPTVMPTLADLTRKQ